MRFGFGLVAVGCLGAVLSPVFAGAQAAAAPAAANDTLLKGFADPPNGARPRVWWHWMNGNISEEGIKLDLEWMQRAGVGGVTIFEGAINTPQVVPHRLIYMTPEWKHAFKYAVETAHGLGMEVAVASSPGWSETGGPWVPASQGIKKMVWSATRVEGGKPFAGVLAHPPTVDGTFQNFAVAGRKMLDGTVLTRPEFYGETAVIAYRIPAGDRTQAELAPKVTTSKGEANVAALSDGDVQTVALALDAAKAGERSWVEFDYGKPQTIQAVTLAMLDDLYSVFGHDYKGTLPEIEWSNDGTNFTRVAKMRPSSVIERTTAFDAVTARYWRIVFPQPEGKADVPTEHITELVLASGARVNEFEKRAGFANEPNFYTIPDPKLKPEDVVKKQDIIDLTGKMKADGTLEWTPPAGNWMVLRIGYSLTGHENGPAPAEATGLEVDKLDRGFVTNYMEGYLKMNAEAVGAENMGANGISHVLTDSIEVGPQNWTDKMLDEFKTRRGYDARLWLPAMTGVVIGSPAETDRFLWDVRRTISELMAESHYGAIADVLHKHGMQYYGEALESHRPSLGDDMEMRSKTDIPMGAMWTWTANGAPQTSYIADLRGAASVAHIYGQNLVGAESMTSRGPAWGWSPNSVKKVADLEFALGVNRFQIHESSHQPVADMAPGMTLGPYGLWFNRNDTWAEQAKPWVNYLARCSYLLQQGRFFGDVAYFYGEEGPLTAVYGWEAAKDIPQGYGFDYVNADVVLHKLTVKNGALVTPAGGSYRILYLGGHSQRMTLAVLKQLLALVKQGAVVVGNRPSDSPSLTDDETQVQAIADALWGKGVAKPGVVRAVGKGKVIAGVSANEALAKLGAKEDFTTSKQDADVMFVHRKLDDGELYFVDNRKLHAERLEASFRVTGKAPELWDAATGATRAASYKTEGGKTTVPLALDPDGTVFVVFRKAAASASAEIAEPVLKPVASLHETLNSNWTVSFEPNRGAPAKIDLARLSSWSEDDRFGVKYFSGTATYTKTVEVGAEVLAPGKRVWLELGDVGELAEVTVNGKPVGTAWKTPYRLEVTGALKPGANRIEVAVTNLWVNRLIGDQQSWSARKYAFADIAPYRADSPLMKSGLLGPVELVAAE
ncbi:MAG: glycosyl hydrolase [Terracidiphilus sp.]|nr:glycosyl hydrolase [Terracidiphilus sp.]